MFEERLRTGQGQHSFGVNGPEGRRIRLQLDGITDDGWVHEIKTSLGRRGRGRATEEVPLDELFGGTRPRGRGQPLAEFGDPRYAADRLQLQRQIEFAKEAKLKGVRVEVNDPELYRYWRDLASREFPGERVTVEFIE